MASVGTVELDLLLNAESFKQQLNSLKDSIPTLKVDALKIEVDRDEIEKSLKGICIPVKFCEDTVDKELVNLKQVIKKQNLSIDIQTQIKIDLMGTSKSLSDFSKSESENVITKKIEVLTDTKAAEDSLKRVSSQTIVVETKSLNAKEFQLNANISDLSILSIQSKLDANEFKIKVNSDISLTDNKNPNANNITSPTVAPTAPVTDDKTAMVLSQTQDSNVKIEKNSEKSNNNLVKVIGALTIFLGIIDTGLNIIEGVRKSVAKLEPGVLRELRNAPATVVRGSFEGTGLTLGRIATDRTIGAGKLGVQEVKDFLKKFKENVKNFNIEDAKKTFSVNVEKTRKIVDNFFRKIFADAYDFFKGKKQKQLEPAFEAKYFLPPATSPRTLSESDSPDFNVDASKFEGVLETVDLVASEAVEKQKVAFIDSFDELKETISDISLDESSINTIKGQIGDLIGSIKDNFSNLTIDSVNEQVVSIVEKLKGEVSNLTVDSVKEQVSSAIVKVKEEAANLTVQSAKDRAKELVKKVPGKVESGIVKAKELAKKIPQKTEDLKGKIKTKVGEVKDRIDNFDFEKIKKQSLEYFEELKGKVSEVSVESIVAQIELISKTFKDKLSEVSVESIKAQVEAVLETFKDKLSGITFESLEAQFLNLIESTKSKLSGAFDSLPKSKEELKSSIASAREKSGKLISDVKEGAKGLVSKNLSEQGIKNYQQIFIELSKELGVKLKNFEMPKIEGSTELGEKITAAYKELSNTIVLPPGIIDLLNNGIDVSVLEQGKEEVFNKVSFLVHELTHAFQTVDDNILSKIELPPVAQGMSKKIEELAVKSRDVYISQLQKLNPGKSLEYIKKKYAETITKVTQREKEAYTLQLLITDKIVKSFSGLVSEKQIQEIKTQVDGVMFDAKMAISDLPIPDVTGTIKEKTEGMMFNAQMAMSSIPVPDVTGIAKEKFDSMMFDAQMAMSGVAVPDVTGAVKGIVDNLMFDVKMAVSSIELPGIKKQNSSVDNETFLPAVEFNPSEIVKGIGEAIGSDEFEKELETLQNVLEQAQVAVEGFEPIEFIQTLKAKAKSVAEQLKPGEITSNVRDKVDEVKTSFEQKDNKSDFDKRLIERQKARQAASEILNPKSFEKDAKEVIDAVKGLKVPTKVNKDNNKSAIQRIKTALSNMARIPIDNINKRRNQILEASIVEIELRAEEIKKSLPDSIGASSVIFATGGFAGKGGAGTADLAKEIEQQFQESLVVPVANKTFDTITKAVDSLPKWLSEIIKDKILKTNLIDGVIPDAKELAAQAKAYADKYNLPVRAIGHSGGGYVVQQAVKQAQAMDVDLKGVGIGTPDVGFLEPQKDPNFQAYLAKDDPLRKLVKPILKNGKTEETAGTGIATAKPADGHASANYLKDLKLLNKINEHFNLTTKKTSSGLGVISGFFKKVSTSVKEAIYPFEVFARKISNADKRISGYSQSFLESIEKIKETVPILKPVISAIQALSPSLIALEIFKTVSGWMSGLIKSSFEVTARFQAMEAVTVFLAGSSDNAAKRFEFLRGEISRLSIDIEGATRGYNKLAATTRGTVLEGKTNEIFTGVSQAGSAFSLTASEVEGSILALSQIAGKGVVSMEELRGQLAERIPGAFQIAARSMNMTEQQLNALIATGSLAAVDFLPKFARQLTLETAGSIDASSQTANAALTRFKNSFTELQVSVGKPLQPIIVPGLDIAAKGLELVSKFAGVLAQTIAILTLVSFVHFNKALITTIKTAFAGTIQIKSLGGAMLTLNNVAQKVLTPTLKALAKQTIILFAVVEVFKVLKFGFDTFLASTKSNELENNLSKRFEDAAKRADELREKLAKLRGEIDNTGIEKNKRGKTNLGNVNQEFKKESEKSADFSGFRKLQYGMKQWQALSKDVIEKRNAKDLKTSINSGEYKNLDDDVKNIINSSDEIITKSKEKSDAISKLTAEATFAKGDELKSIKSQIEILQTELQADLAGSGDKAFGLSAIDDTAQTVSYSISELKKDLEDAVQEEPKKVIKDQIKVLEDYQKSLDNIISKTGESQPLTMFIANISKIGMAFQESSRIAELNLTKIKGDITKNLRENLKGNYNAENNAALEQSRVEVTNTIQKIKDTQTMINGLSGTLKSSSGGVSEYFEQFKDFSLEKLQSELTKTDEKDEARKRTLETLIKLREAEADNVKNQATLEEQLLQQERERMRVAMERLDRELAVNRAKADISDANAQSVSVRQQIMGGSSQADIGLIESANQLKVAQDKEKLREQELAGINKLNSDKLISAKDYENKVRELTVQGAQNSLAILQAKLGEEQALRVKEVEKIQRQLENDKVVSEAKQADIGFNVERKGFDVQQNNLKEQVSTGKSDELNKQLEYQKQLAEKSGDIAKQEKISSEIYQNQLASLAVKQDLQTKSLELTQAQQRLEMQRSEMQAQVALLEAESQVNQLQANKATAEEIAIAQQTVDIRQKQVNFISEQRENLVEVQQLEKDNLAIQNETQKKDLERSRNLQVIEEDEKRISKEIEIAKSNNELRNKEIERSSQLLNSQLELYKVQSDYKKSELDFQTELANKVNNVSALETIKAISYADQVASLKVQNLAQTESLKLTQEQQRIQAEIDVLDAQATLRKLELNKGSAQDIELAKQQLDAAQQQLGNLEAIQSNERERVGIEQQSALKNLERQQYLEMQDLAVKKITASLEQQSKLFNAQQNVLQSVNELDKQRLDYQLELANRSGDINRVEQLKAEIYLQQREEILRQGDAQLKSLDITQKQNNIELERQKLMAQSLLLEAKANLEKGKLKGASAQELNDLQQYVTIQEQQLSGIQQLVSANQEVQSLEKQQLEIQQQTKLEQIDQQRQLELIDLQAQKITKSYELQQQQLDLNNSELERQSALVNAKSGLNDSVSNLEKQRLDFRMQLAELAENEVQKQQIKQQLYEQELKSLAQRQAIERETLKIAQLKQNIDIKRQEIQAEIATLEAQANIEQAKARGAGESELAALYKVLALRMQQEKSVQADKVNLAQIQELERQKLNVDQTAASENLQFQQTIEQTRSAKEQQQKASEGNKSSSSGNIPLNINIPPFQPIPIEEVKISKTDSDKKNEIIESMKVTATNVYINGTVSASSGQNVNIETQNSDLEKVKKVENEINKLAEESRLKAANAAMDDYINKWNSDAEKERIASGLSAEQATAGGYEQARLAREEAERIKADLASGKLKTTGAEGFKPQAIMTPLQRLQAELDAAQKAVDSSKNKPNKNTSNSQETEGGTNVNVENLVIVSSDPTGDARQVLNDLAANKGKC